MLCHGVCAQLAFASSCHDQVLPAARKTAASASLCLPLAGMVGVTLHAGPHDAAHDAHGKDKDKDKAVTAGHPRRAAYVYELHRMQVAQVRPCAVPAHKHRRPRRPRRPCPRLVAGPAAPATWTALVSAGSCT